MTSDMKRIKIISYQIFGLSRIQAIHSQTGKEIRKFCLKNSLYANKMKIK